MLVRDEGLWAVGKLRAGKRFSLLSRRYFDPGERPIGYACGVHLEHQPNVVGRPCPDVLQTEGLDLIVVRATVLLLRPVEGEARLELQSSFRNLVPDGIPEVQHADPKG
jgi:hypothetical protein